MRCFVNKNTIKMKITGTERLWNYVSELELMKTFGGSNESFENGKKVGEEIGKYLWTIVFGVLILRGIC